MIQLRSDELNLEFEVRQNEIRNELLAQMRSERETTIRNKLQTKLEK